MSPIPLPSDEIGRSATPPALNGRSATRADSTPAAQAIAEPALFDRLFRILRMRKWVVLQAVVIVPLVVLGLSLLQTKTYSASASLLFHQSSDALSSLDNNNSSSAVDPARVFATNQQLISLPVIAARTARDLGGGTTAAQVRSAVSVSGSGESDVVTVTATSPSAQRAAAIANAYGNAYIQFRRAADQSQLAGAIVQVNSSLAALPPTQLNSPEATRLRNRLDQLRFAQSLQTGNAEVVQSARPPTQASSPNIKRNVILGILLGVILGLALAALLDRFDRRLKTPDDLERAYGLPILARVPRSSQLRGQSVADLNGTVERGVEAESFRMLRANLRYFDFGHNLRSVLVASPVQGDGKSTVARSLAATMASMGDATILVEADLHREGSGIPLAGSPLGLSTVLAGGELDDALLEVPITGAESARRLIVLPSGPPPPNPSELLSSDRMLEVLRELEGRFDLVVVDSPPLNIVSDALALVPAVSGIVVVSGVRRTTRDAATGLRKELGMLGGRVLGVVANYTTVERGDYHAYHGG